MEIITISEPECGSKPTSYAAILKEKSGAAYVEDVKQHLGKGLVGKDPTIDIDNLAKELVREGYVWVGVEDRYLVEITDINEGEE